MLSLRHEDLLQKLILQGFLLLLLEGKDTLEQERVILWGKVKEIGQERNPEEPQITQNLQIVIIIIVVILHSFFLFPLVMGQRIHIFSPFCDQLNHIQSQLREMVEGVRKQLQFGFTKFSMFIIVEDHLYLVALYFIFLLLLLSLFIIESFFGHMEILVDILW